MNPTDKTGNGSEELHGKNSFVILADEGGKGVRVLSSQGEFYNNPEERIGESVVQVKQYDSGNPDRYDEMVVVGYVAEDGKKFGYVPNRKVSMFIYN